MKVSYNWLKSYLDFKEDPRELAEILTDTGLEVEKVEKFDSVPGGLLGVVVGEVLELWQHPNADKLKVTKVDIGAESPVQIVCGAPNVAKGQKVLVATVGAVLYPEPDKAFEIKKAKIRGEESLGMICAEDELGLGKSHDGIMVLPENARVGLAAADYLGLESDYILEIGLTPNRTDAFGHFGVARDLAARLSLKKSTRAKLPQTEAINTNEEEGVDVEIQDIEGCGRYDGLLIENVKVGPSPNWLQNRLRSIGSSPINNIVDITNYVLHETGQPLHAFDADKIANRGVFVKTHPSGTKFTTLDSVERELHEEDLVISDDKGGLCLAGVYGGLTSGVTEKTQSVFLESAWFDPVRIRKTAKRHGLNTDASFRFERGVDPNGLRYALLRAANLILEIAGGNIKGGIVSELGELPKPVEVSFSIQRFIALTGVNIEVEVLDEILDALGFEVSSKNGGNYLFKVPSYRVDVTREIDVIEEVLRIVGYNSVPLPNRMSLSVGISDKPSRQEVINTISNALIGSGFSETMSNGLTRSDYILDVEGKDRASELVYMLNPLSLELDVLRPNLLVSVLENVSYNLNRQSDRLKIFEIGKAYNKTEPGYAEKTVVSIALTGSRFIENWNNPVAGFDLSDLLGAVKALASILGLSFKYAETSDLAWYDYGLDIVLGKKNIGSMGRVSTKAAKRYGIKKELFVAELDLDTCFSAMRHGARKSEGLAKFPAVRRDLSLLLDKGVRFSEIERIAFEKAGKLVKEVGLFDVYEGKNLPEGKKSYAVSFVIQDVNKTLNDKQIDRTMEIIRQELETTLGAQLR